MKRSRRAFLTQSIVASGALIAASVGDAALVPKTQMPAAPGLPMVPESDAQAMALGFKLDTAKVDKAKFPKHDATQKCANCVLYQGKAGAKTGPCALFVGKSVPAGGWCSAWVKKA